MTIVSLNQYQQAALRTADNMFGEDGRTTRDGFVNQVLGLVGESGEVAEHVKKHLFHGHALDRTALVKELGDCLYYVAVLAWSINAELSEVATVNRDKLLKRYPDGFSESASKAREDEP